MRWDAFFLSSEGAAPEASPWGFLGLPEEPEHVMPLEKALWNVVRGQWVRVAALCEEGRTPAPSLALPLPDAHAVADAFATFHTIALRKSGKVEAERRFAQEVAPGLLSRGRWDLALAFAVESAASAMNQGDYLSALARLDTLNEALVAFSGLLPAQAHTAGVLSVAPRFWRWRASIVRGLSCQTLGLVDEAEKCLREQVSLLARLPHPDFPLALRRRRMSLLVETERFEAARGLLSGVESSLEGVATGFTRILWHVEALRLHLALQDTTSARRELGRAEALVAHLGLPRSFLNLAQEKAELSLSPRATGHAEASPQESVRTLRALINDGEARVSLDSDCALRLLLAESLWREGQVQDALLQLEIARAVAERARFGRLRVRILLALWSLSHSLGLQAEALELARLLTREPLLKHFPLHERLAAGVSLCAKLSTRPLSSLVALSASGVSKGVMVAWLLRYRMMSSLEEAYVVRVLGDKGVSSLSLPALQSLRTPLLLVCRRTHDVAVFGAEGARLCLAGETRSSAAARAVLAAFLESGRKELGAARILRILSPGAPYRTARDAERVRAAVARLRKRLLAEGLTCTLVSGPTKATYVLRPTWGETAFLEERGGGPHGQGAADALSTARGRGRPKADVTPREKDVATMAERLGSFQFADIHTHFPVQRQTLHAYLQRLVDKGRLHHEKRGRASRYVWRG